MHIHIAIFRWKPEVTQEAVDEVSAAVEALQPKIPGIVEISCGANTSQYGEGYTHVVLVRGETAQAIDAYRTHPDHTRVARRIEEMEERGIGVDFVTR